MTITLDIKPEIKAELARRAAAQGSVLEEYAVTLLEKAVNAPIEAIQSRHNSSRKTLREMFESVSGLADDVDFSRDKSPARPADLS